MSRRSWWRRVLETQARVRKMVRNGNHRRRYGPRLEGLEDRIAPAVHVWSGNGFNTRWSNPANWIAGNVPRSNETDDVILQFPEVVQNYATTDDIPDLTVNSLVIQGTGYTFQGPDEAAVTLTLKASENLNSGFNQGAIYDEQGGNTFSSRQLRIELPFSNYPATFYVNAGTLSVDCFITGDMVLEKFGGGTLALNGNNSHAGTNLLDGAIQVGSDHALGNNEVFLGPYTHLSAINGPHVVPNHVILNAPGINAGSPIFFEGNNDLTLTGFITGGGSLVTRILGTLTLAGDYLNQYQGYTEIDAGRLSMGSVDKLPFGTAVIVNSGGYPPESPFRGNLSTNGFDTEIGSLAGDGDLSLVGELAAGEIGFPRYGILTVGGDNTNTTYSGHLVDGGMSGVTKMGNGIFTFNSIGTYDGPTDVQAGSFVLGSSSAISSSSDVSVHMYVPVIPPDQLVPVPNPPIYAVFDTAGFDVTIGSLAGDGMVDVRGATLTVGTTGKDTEFSGYLSSSTGTGNVVKTGAGVLSLSGTSSAITTVSVNAGTLALKSASALPPDSLVILTAGATLFVNTSSTSIGSLEGSPGSHVSLNGRLVTGGNSRSTAFDGSIFGSGSLLKVGNGTFTLAAPNTYTGGTTIFTGTLKLGTVGAIPTGTSVSIGPHATLDLDGHSQILNDISNSGVVSLGSGVLFLTNDGTTIYHGSIFGTGNLIKTAGQGTGSTGGGGLLGLDGDSAYSGLTDVGLGELAVNGFQPNSTVRIEAGASLRGSGSVGSIIALGDISPGAASDFSETPGRLSSYGDVAFDAESTFTVQLNGTSLGQTYDQLLVNGSADITAGPRLQLSLGYGPKIGDSYTILTAADGITGSFANLPDGAIILANGSRFLIGYSETNVTLTCVSPPARVGIITPGRWAPGALMDVTVAALDSLGNISSDYTGTIHLVSANLAGLPSDYTFTASDFGTHTFHVVPISAGTQTITVTDSVHGISGDSAPISIDPYIVVNTNDDGPGSLRQAILNANANPGLDTITFNVPGPGIHKIAVGSSTGLPLPDITDAVTIDGYTQSGASPNTLAVGDNAVVTIALDGSGLVGGSNGLHLKGGGSTVEGLMIDNFARSAAPAYLGGNGVLIDTKGNNVIRGNILGTQGPGGQQAYSNGNAAVAVDLGSSGNRIGGDAPADRNVLSGSGEGISLAITASGNTVEGNYIGTDPTGTIAVPNFDGIVDSGSGDTIGGTTAGARNVIAGNNRVGVYFYGGTRDLLVGNYIGTRATGSAALGNAYGVLANSRAGADSIGGTTIGSGNVIGGNSIGIEIDDAGSAFGTNDLVIEGNFIGTDAAATLHLANGYGILLQGAAISQGSANNMIGGAGVGAGNVIANNSAGVVLNGPSAKNNFVFGNFIGTDPTGTSSIGNAIGVLLEGGASGNLIGGISPGAGNRIAFNGAAGVAVLDAGTIGNAIRGNSIYSNTGLGIDLGNDGVSLNDVGDGDSGPNNLLNYPRLNLVGRGPSTHVAGNVSGLANTSLTLDFYATSELSGPSQGGRYLGSAFVITDASGRASFDVILLAATSGEEVITATATDDDGNTSEFTANRTPVALAGGPYFTSEGGSVTLDASASYDLDLDTLTYSWDVNGDGIYGDAIGVNPTLTWQQLNALDIVDGIAAFNVSVRVDDGYQGVSTSTAVLMTVKNTAPTVSLSGAMSGVEGQSLAFTLGAVDPSSVDQSAGFTYQIDWDGDNVVDDVAGGRTGLVIQHRYAAPGIYTIHVRAVDKDGDSSPTISQSESITTFAIQGNDLAIGGTVNDDMFMFSPGSNPGELTAKLNGARLGTFTIPGSVQVYGGDGTDTLSLSGFHGDDEFDVHTNFLLVNGSRIESHDVEGREINAGDGNDRINVFDGAATINGGAGTDLLLAVGSTSNQWRVTGANAGSLNGTVLFSNVENLQGGTGDDTFGFTNAGKIAGLVDGGSGAGSDVLDYSLVATSVTVNLRDMTATKAGHIANLEGVVGSSDLTDKLIGADAANNWAILSPDAGILNDSFKFSSVEFLTGGKAADDLDFSNLGGPVTIDLANKTATGLSGRWADMESLIGTGHDDTLIGANSRNKWNITGIDAGNVGGATGLAFAGFGNLKGGSLDDTFRFSTNAMVTGSLDGGAGINTLDFSAVVTRVMVNLVTGLTKANGLSATVANVQNVTGGSSDDLIVGDAAANILQGGAGNDLLISGQQSDSLTGGSGEDLLIAGATSYDSNQSALDALFSLWNGAGTYLSRIAALQAGTSTNGGTVKLDVSTVFDDAAVDTLTGGAGQDWFFALFSGLFSDTTDWNSRTETRSLL